MHILAFLSGAAEAKASDLHITTGVPPVIRVNGELQWLDNSPLSPSDIQLLIKQLLTARQLRQLEEKHEIDISFSHPGIGRFRVNVYKQRGSYCAAIRSVLSYIPSLEELGLPPVIKELSRKQRGLILVTGPTGSGKSTTLAYMINLINNERKSHVITLEDPIEYLYRHNMSIINQREIGSDVSSFSSGLRAVLRQDPDVILVGEMRDLETISIAITAAETGHLVFSTLHTIGADKTIDRIVDVFPPYQQQQIKIQLSTVLEGIISQQLLPRSDGDGRIPAIEVMLANHAIRNLIREGKTHQIQTVIQTGLRAGMQTMDGDLLNLYRKGIISKECILQSCREISQMKKYLGG